MGGQGCVDGSLRGGEQDAKGVWGNPLALSAISGLDAKSKKSRKRTEIQRELARGPGLIPW